MDILIDLYKEDRKIILEKLNPPVDTCIEIKSPVNKQIPRSILVDNKQYSEPSSPIVNRPPKRFMQRNHSDLGSRIRKRVTYRLHSSPVCPSAQDDKYFLQENNIPRSLSASYPSRAKFCGSEDCVVASEKSGLKEKDETECETLKSTKRVSDNVLSIPEFVYSPDSERLVDELHPETTNPESQPVLDAIERSNSQHSLLDATSTCSDPFSPEEETIALLEKEGDSSNENQTKLNQSKSQECEEVYYHGDNHRVLVPIGTMKALSADVTDV